jgi:ubiquinone biosynthesis protein
MSNVLPIPSIGRTVRNIGRLQTIVSTFARHGFGELFTRMGLSRDSQAGNATPETAAQRARAAFAELGTTFVKLGQVLSTRPDLLPEDFIREFKTLQDAVPEFGFDDVKKTVEEALGASLETLYASFDEAPMAAASVAQAHAATLHDGSRVVVKVQRPGIDVTIDNDISILHFLAEMIERYIPESKIYNPTGIVSEFFRTMRNELDFTNEAQNAETLATNSQDDPHLKIPKIYWQLTARKVLTIERFDGIKANHLDEARAAGIDTKELARVGVRSFFRMVFVDGFFHGDLHAGNIFILGPSQLGLIDFGICGRFDRPTREAIAGLFVSLIRRDYVAMARGYIDLSERTNDRIDVERFAKDLSQALDPVLSKPLSQINTAELTFELAKVTTRHRVPLARDLMLFFRALVTLEALGRDLDPELMLLEHGVEFAKILAKERLKPERIAEDLFRFGSDIAMLSQDLPGEARLFLRKLNRESFRVELTLAQQKEIEKSVSKSGNKLALAICFAGLVIAAAILLAGRGQTTSLVEHTPTAAIGVLCVLLFAMWRS